MRVVKRIVLVILILTTIAILFRGWFYRHLVTYKSVGQRTRYSAKNAQLIDHIELNTGNKEGIDVKSIITLSLSITSGLDAMFWA